MGESLSIDQLLYFAICLESKTFKTKANSGINRFMGESLQFSVVHAIKDKHMQL